MIDLQIVWLCMTGIAILAAVAVIVLEFREAKLRGEVMSIKGILWRALMVGPGHSWFPHYGNRSNGRGAARTIEAHKETTRS